MATLNQSRVSTTETTSRTAKTTNPFSTRFTRPDAVTYLFSSTDVDSSKWYSSQRYSTKRSSLEQNLHSLGKDSSQPDSTPLGPCPLTEISNAFCQSGFIGQIVGPHGSGKTTLTHAMQRELRGTFDVVRRLTVRNQSVGNHLGISSIQTVVETTHSSGSMLLIIDGVERLSLLQRMMLVGYCKKSQSKPYPIGLLITTHRKLVGVPVLFKTIPSLELLKQIVQNLAPDFAPEPELLASVYEQTDGNLREALMSLYDAWQ